MANNDDELSVYFTTNPKTNQSFIGIKKDKLITLIKIAQIPKVVVVDKLYRLVSESSILKECGIKEIKS